MMIANPFQSRRATSPTARTGSRPSGGGGNPFVTLKRTAKNVNYEFGQPAEQVEYDIAPTRNSIVGNFGDAGRATRSLGEVEGGLQHGIAPTGLSIGGSIGDAGTAPTTFGQAQGRLRHGIDDAGQIQNRYDTDFNASRQRVENTLFDRLNREHDRDRAGLEATLVNRGLRPGSDAYNRALGDFGRERQDARASAILSAGQEHSRLTNLARQEAEFGRQSQAQRFAQNQANAIIGNQARGQSFAEELARGQFGQAGQAQNFNQALNRAQFRNQAQAQQFGQNQANAIIGNQARGQSFAEQLARANLANTGQAQDFGQFLGRAQFQNAAQGQEFGQNQARSILHNQANALDFGQNLERGNFYNRAQQQVHQQDLDRFNAEIASRNQALGEASQLTNLLQGIAGGAPGGGGRAGRIPTTDYAGLVQDNYRNQVSAANQRNSLAGSIIGAGIGLF